MLVKIGPSMRSPACCTILPSRAPDGSPLLGAADAGDDMARMLQNRVLGYLAAILGIGAVTAACALLRSHINEMTVALAMLLVVLLVAAVWERWPGLLASVLGMLCLNYFFLPPLYTFTIADPKNWIALAAFFITALTAGRLSAWAKTRERSASRRTSSIFAKAW